MTSPLESRPRFECSACGWVSLPPESAGIAVVFHPCKPKGRRRRLVRIPEVRDTTPEEARTAVWHGFRDALPGDALLRPIDDVELVDAARSLGFGEEEE